MGFGAGPIPFSSIDRFATRYGLDHDEFERLEQQVRLFDGYYRSHKAVRPKPPPKTEEPAKEKRT